MYGRVYKNREETQYALHVYLRGQFAVWTVPFCVCLILMKIPSKWGDDRLVFGR